MGLSVFFQVRLLRAFAVEEFRGVGSFLLWGVGGGGLPGRL